MTGTALAQTACPGRFSIGPADGVPIRVRFLDVGAPADYGTTWGPSPNVDLHHTVYAQDRWSPSDRVSITAGVRVDYQNASYKSRRTASPVITDGVFPAATAVAGKSLVRTTDTAVRLGVDLRSDRQRANRSEGILRPLLQQPRRLVFRRPIRAATILPSTTSTISIEISATTAPQELGTLRFTLGGATASVNPNLHTPYIEEFSGSLEHQFWGESSARVTLVRKNSRRFVPVLLLARTFRHGLAS